MSTARATVCICAIGADGYHAAAASATRSVLEQTDWDLVLVTDRPGMPDLAGDPRVTVVPIAPIASEDRAQRFLVKFTAIELALAASDTPLMVLLDADARIVRSTTAADVAAALGDHGIGMVEQAGIRGSDMSRASFLEHYRDHALRFIDPDASVPDLEDFRYFNSGVVLARRETLAALAADALQRVGAATDPHALGDHMISDQDYFQHWALTAHPGSCVELEWEWNHCSWWHDPFPREGARVLHFSNFCNGPTPETLVEMDAISARVAAGDASASGVTAVVVTHRSASCIAECARALRLAGVERIVVVDNASDDGTIARAEAAGCDIVAIQTNHGFAVAANAGAQVCETDVICFVNPDCLVNAETIRRGAELATDPKVCAVPDFRDADDELVAGVCGGYTRRRVLADCARNSGGHQRTAALLGRGRRSDARGWAWPLGACVFVSRASFERLGGFDESYFLYMEDVDFGRRWCAAGGRVESTGTIVEHAQQQGADVSTAVRSAHLTTARMQYAAAAFGPLTGAMARALAGRGR